MFLRILCSLVLFITGALFGKTIALEGSGFFLKMYLFLAEDFHFSYEALDFREGKLCVSGAVFNGKEVDAEVEKIFIEPKGKNIECLRPKILVKNIPTFKKKKNSWKLSMQDGVFLRKGLGEIAFSYEKNWPHQIGRFTFHKENSSWDLEAIESGKEILVYANFHEFDLSFLHEWLDVKGTVSGFGHFLINGDRCSSLLTELTIQKGGYKDFLSDVAGNLEIEGEVGANFLEKGRMRLNIQDALFQGKKGEIGQVKGNVTFASKLGAKWELEATCYAKEELFPLTIEGKAFLQGPRPWWIETNAKLGNGTFSFQTEGRDWKGEMEGLRAKEVSLLQSFLALKDEKIEGFDIQDIQVNGEGYGTGDTFTLSFAAIDLICAKDNLKLFCNELDGHFEDKGVFSFEGASIQWENLLGTDWVGRGVLEKDLSLFYEADGKIGHLGHEVHVEGALKESDFSLHVIEKEGFAFQGSGVLDEGNWFLQGRGQIAHGMPFDVPHLEKKEEEIFFDIRLENGYWDAARLCGIWDGVHCSLEKDKTHLLGHPLLWEGTGLNDLIFSTSIPVSEVIHMAPLFFSNVSPLKNWQKEKVNGAIDFQFSYQNGAKKVQFSSDQIEWMKNERPLMKTKVGGMIYPRESQMELKLSQIWIDFASIGGKDFGGVLEGDGCLSWKDHWEADFDFMSHDLKWKEVEWENEGAFHVSIDSHGKCLCTGIDLKAVSSDVHLQSDLLEYDHFIDFWKVHACRLYFPPGWAILPKNEGLDLIADLEWAPSRSHFACFVEEGQIPIGEGKYFIRNGALAVDKEKIKCSFQYPYESDLIQVQTSLTSFEKELTCKVQLALVGIDEKMTIDLRYKKENGLSFEAIEGQFGGLDASFHTQGIGFPLVGSTKVHFGRFAQFLPPKLVQLTDDLKMGKGFEFKGNLWLGSTPSFEGIISGKQVELFGSQFRTMLGQITIGKEQVTIRDLKISDSACIMKIDQIVARADPWSVSMPHLSIFELRPSLLQKVGAPPVDNEAGPLVIRELKMNHFQGLLDDPKTYTASGELTFINSYRREHTVFDFPSDFLGRIVGLDLELLIPVRGTLTYELKNGLFELLDLKDAYSEADRSQFFLHQDPMPCMDLDGNIQVAVKMKQFVLFKLTESFVIFIDGTLTNPDVHLRKKKRFLEDVWE